jgi:tetratricopeptide (TPR) repeat protein
MALAGLLVAGHRDTNTQASDTLDPYYQRAAAAEQAGNYDQAIRVLRAAKQIAPHDERLPATLGVALFHEDFVSDAIQEFRDALRLRPDDVDARRNLTTALIEFGDIQDAIPNLERVLKDDPKDQTSQDSLALCYLKAGRWTDATGQYRRLLEGDPSSPELLYNLAIAEKHLGDIDSARSHLLRSLELKPDFPAAKFELGELCWQSGMLDDAIAQLQSLRQAHPDFIAAYAPLAEVLRQNGEIHEALSVTKALLRSAESASGYQELAILQKQTKDVDAAAKSFHRAEQLRNLAKPREAAKLITSTAVHLSQNGDQRAAIEKLKFAVQLDPSLAEAHYQLAIAFHLQHEDPNASTEFKKALALDDRLKLPYGWH